MADAIRAKGGTTEQLVFPGGFVTAIQDISTGAALNFKVIGGTAEPENPTENTIWVNTDFEITGWSFSATEPVESYNGIVWFKVGAESSRSFNALKENELNVYPIIAKQYNVTWSNVNAKIYKNSQWVSFFQSFAIFENGAFSSGSFNYLISQTDQYAKASINASNELEIVADGDTVIWVYSTDKFNLTYASKLLFTIRAKRSANDSTTSATLKFGLSTNNTNKDTDFVAMGSLTTIDDKAYSTYEIPLDENTISGTYYIKFWASQNTRSYYHHFYISDIRVE